MFIALILSCEVAVINPYCWFSYIIRSTVEIYCLWMGSLTLPRFFHLRGSGVKSRRQYLRWQYTSFHILDFYPSVAFQLFCIQATQEYG